MLPILAAVHEFGGEAPADKVISRVTEQLRVPESVANDYRPINRGKWGPGRRCAWRHQLHRVRMDAVYAGYLKSGKWGYWTLTEKGRDSLVNCRPGIILVVYETPNGQAVFADVLTAAASLEQNSVNLFFTSPMYPNVKRGYGRFTEAEVIELIVKAAGFWRDALKDDGSIVLNFKDVFRPKAETGGCVRSLYQEKIALALVEDVRLFLADKFVWSNPSHLPDNPFVTIHKVRTNMAHENLYWFSKGPNPKTNLRDIMVDPKPSTIETLLRKARQNAVSKVGPSGHNNIFEEQMRSVAAGKTLKVTPRNILEIANSNPHRELSRKLADLGLPRHDAMMPVALARHFIRFLTDPRDLVVDNFGGSASTLVACEEENRDCIVSDRSLAHLLASAVRQKQVFYNPRLAA